jgi:hypothetical protein
VCIALFVALPLEAAAIWSLLGGYLLLPSGTQIDIPMLPPIDKTSVPAVATLLLCWMKGTRVPYPKRSMLVYLLAIGYVIAPIFTSLDNSYELQTATGSVPGFYPLDSLKIAGRNVILLAPFYVGSRFLSTDEGRSQILRAFSVSALFYSIPMLLEVRLSPQFHRWVYGYFPHSFAEQIRNGGYRPVVFLQQGIQVAVFTAMAVVATIVLARNKRRVLTVPAGLAAAYLSFVLLLCKTLSATIYAVMAAPIVMFTRPRTWVRFSCALLLLVTAYPLLRSLDVIPVQHMASAANSVSLDRSRSFETRLANEEALLGKALQKPWFGWGTWGRNRLRDQYTGQDITLADGGWIIEFGTFGALGYLTLFGLLAASGFRALRVVGNEVDANSMVIGGLSLLLAMNVLDMIPNSNMSPLTLLVAGSIGSMAYVRRRSGIGVRRPKTPTAPPDVLAAQ